MSDLTAAERARVAPYVTDAEGPVFALYETIDAVEQKARDEGRWLTPEEEALIHSLRVRTHELFEAELRAQGLRGMPEES